MEYIFKWLPTEQSLFSPTHANAHSFFVFWCWINQADGMAYNSIIASCNSLSIVQIIFDTSCQLFHSLPLPLSPSLFLVLPILPIPFNAFDECTIICPFLYWRWKIVFELIKTTFLWLRRSQHMENDCVDLQIRMQLIHENSSIRIGCHAINWFWNFNFQHSSHVSNANPTMN